MRYAGVWTGDVAPGEPQEHTQRGRASKHRHMGATFLGGKVTRSSSYASRRSITKDTYLHLLLLPRGNSQLCPQARNIGDGSLRPITPSSLTDIRPGGMTTALSSGNIVTYYGRWTVAISPSHLCHHSTSAISPPLELVSDKEGRAESHSITLRLSSIYASTRAQSVGCGSPRLELSSITATQLPPQSLPVRSIPPT